MHEKPLHSGQGSRVQPMSVPPVLTLSASLKPKTLDFSPENSTAISTYALYRTHLWRRSGWRMATKGPFSV